MQVMAQTHSQNEWKVCESAKKELQRLSKAFPFWNYDLYKKFGLSFGNQIFSKSIDF